MWEIHILWDMKYKKRKEKIILYNYYIYMSLSNILVPNDYNLYANSLSMQALLENPGYTGASGATGYELVQMDTLWSNNAYSPPHIYWGSVDLTVANGMTGPTGPTNGPTGPTGPTGSTVTISTIFSAVPSETQILPLVTAQIAYNSAIVANSAYNSLTSTFVAPVTGVYNINANIGLMVTANPENEGQVNFIGYILRTPNTILRKITISYFINQELTEIQLPLDLIITLSAGDNIIIENVTPDSPSPSLLASLTVDPFTTWFQGFLF